MLTCIKWVRIAESGKQRLSCILGCGVLCSLRHRYQNVSGSYPASYTVDAGNSCTGNKPARTSPPCSAKVHNDDSLAWSFRPYILRGLTWRSATLTQVYRASLQSVISRAGIIPHIRPRSFSSIHYQIYLSLISLSLDIVWSEHYKISEPNPSSRTVALGPTHIPK
jgi:hypothetical protein